MVAERKKTGKTRSNADSQQKSWPPYAISDLAIRPPLLIQLRGKSITSITQLACENCADLGD